MQTDSLFTFQHVYCVTESDSDGRRNYSIGIRPSILPKDFRIRWQDTEGHTRTVDYRKENDLTLKVKNFLKRNPPPCPENFSVTDREHKLTYKLETLTLDLYNQKFKDIARLGFASTKEVQDFYLNHFFG